MTTLDNEIAAYEEMQRRLEANHHGKWVVIRDGELVGAYGSFAAAADEATRRFGRGPYLIREVGAVPRPLPASVLYRPVR